LSCLSRLPNLAHLASTIAIALLAAVSLAVPAGASTAQTDTTQAGSETSQTTTTSGEPTPNSADLDSVGDIVPKPNSGHDPAYGGDRGSGQQYAVMGGILLALAIMVVIVRRQMRAAKDRSHTSSQSGTPPR
jgi:hypothetical protein